MHIYKITNIINGKLYIGLTTQKNPSRRFDRHVCNALAGVDTYFYNSIRRYGKSSFKFEVIYSVNNMDDLNWAERYFIRLYQTTDKQYGYNILPGGKHFMMSEETKLKLSIKIKEQFKNGRKANKSRIGVAPWNKGLKGLPGKIKSLETRRKLSESHKGKIKTIQHRVNLSKAKIEYYKTNKPVNCKKVICLNDNKIFNSASDASKFYNFPITAASRVCNGQRKSYKGHIFKYIESTNGQ